MIVFAICPPPHFSSKWQAWPFVTCTVHKHHDFPPFEAGLATQSWPDLCRLAAGCESDAKSAIFSSFKTQHNGQADRLSRQRVYIYIIYIIIFFFFYMERTAHCWMLPLNWMGWGVCSWLCHVGASFRESFAKAILWKFAAQWKMKMANVTLPMKVDTAQCPRQTMCQGAKDPLRDGISTTFNHHRTYLLSLAH